MVDDILGSIGPAALTSVVTTLATLGVTSGWKSVSQRLSHKQFPIKVKRGSGNSYELINESKRPFTNVYAYIGQQDGSSRPIDFPSTSLLPKRSMPLGDVIPGETISIQWHEFRRGKETYYSLEPIRVREDAEEYLPKKRDQSTGYGG